MLGRSFAASLTVLFFFVLSSEIQAQCSARFNRYPDSTLLVNFGRPVIDARNLNLFYEYQWDFGDGSTQSYSSWARKIEHRYNQAGTYKVSRLVRARRPDGSIACTDTFTRYILVGNNTQNCAASLYSRDTITSMVYIMTDSSAAFSSSQALSKRLTFNFGGYEYTSRIATRSATNLHQPGDVRGGIAPKAGVNRACLGLQLFDSDDSVHYECFDCKEVFVDVPYSVSVSDQSLFNSNTGVVHLVMNGNTNPPLSANHVLEYFWEFPSLKMTLIGNNQSASLYRPGKYYYRRGFYVKDTLNNQYLGGILEWDSITVLQANTCKANFLPKGPTGINGRMIRFENFSANLHALNTSSQFRWDLGDGSSSTQPHPTHIYANSGAYQVQLIHEVLDSSGMLICSDSILKTVLIPSNSHQCQASFVVRDSLSTNFNLVVQNTSAPALTDTNLVISYLWDFGDGQSSTHPYPQHTYASNGAFLLCLSIQAIHKTTGDTCLHTFCDTVGIDSLGNLIFKNAQGFSLNVIGSGSLALPNKDKSNFAWTLYPNPSEGQLRIGYLDLNKGPATLRLLDLQGKVIESYELENTVEIDLSKINPGLYLVSIKQSENQAFHRLQIHR